jgi:hypothetical protein
LTLSRSRLPIQARSRQPEPPGLGLWESPWGPVSPNLYRALLAGGGR